jgi:methylmalonyl-CoA carboxyltransferase 12S subunit
MSQVTLKSLSEELDALRTHLAALTAKIAEMGGAEVSPPAAPAPVAPVAAAPEPEEISEEILLALSAAVAAYLGKRAHIRTVRLLSSTAWAQQGRVNIQASHRLNVPHHHNRVR